MQWSNAHISKLLNQPDRATLGWMVVLALAQFSFIASIDGFSLGLWLKIVLVGAPLCSALYQCNLEFALNLCLGSAAGDRTLAILANWPTGLPYAELVRSFHSEHMAFQGSGACKDPERPSPWELQYIHGAGLKMLYLAIHPLVLAHRLLFRQALTLTRFVWWNLGSQFLCNLMVWYWWGGWAVFYMLASTYVGASPWHPAAFYFLTHHHLCTTEIEVNTQTRTYSYYGILNAFTLNAGYHRERHLCRQVPWSKLPLIRQMYFSQDAPQAFYTSVLQAIHDFIFQPALTLHS